MKIIKYLIVLLTAVFNGFVAFMTVEAQNCWWIYKKFFPADWFKPNVSISETIDMYNTIEKYARFHSVICAIAVLVGIALTVLSIKLLVPCFKNAALRARIIAVVISAFVAVAAFAGVCCTTSISLWWLFAVLASLMFAALYVLTAALYKVLCAFLDKHSRAGAAIFAAFAVLSLFSGLVAVSCIKHSIKMISDFICLYVASISVGASLFLFGVFAIVSRYVKRLQFPGLKACAALLLVFVVLVSVLSAFATGKAIGSYNIVTNIAVNTGLARWGLNGKDYVCAYRGFSGKRIYLVDDTGIIEDEELSALLECVKIGDKYSRNVNGVDYKLINLEFFAGYFIFTVIPE